MPKTATVKRPRRHCRPDPDPLVRPLLLNVQFGLMDSAGKVFVDFRSSVVIDTPREMLKVLAEFRRHVTTAEKDLREFAASRPHVRIPISNGPWAYHAGRPLEDLQERINRK